MISTLARSAFLLILAGMVLAYAVSAGTTKPAEPQHDQTTERMYS